MKKLLLLLLSAFCLGACSVDSLDLEPVDSQLLVLDASYTVDGCDITTFDIGNAGKIEVRNDRDSIYVDLIANSTYEIAESYLHIAADLSGFPTKGNSSNPGISIKDMDHQFPFSPTKINHTYTFPVDSFGDSFLVASYTVFQQGKKKYSFWAGDLSGNQWSYFGYDLNEHPYNAGADKSGEITVSEANAISSWDEARKIYTAMLDPGVPEGQFIGSFEPTIWEIINRFNSSEGGPGEYTTVYTIGEGNCTDSVTLTLNIVPDDSI